MALFWFGLGFFFNLVARCSPGTWRTRVWSLPGRGDVDLRGGEGDTRSLQQSHPSGGRRVGGGFSAPVMSPTGA